MYSFKKSCLLTYWDYNHMDPLSLAWEEGNNRFKKAGRCLIHAVSLTIPWTRGWAAWGVAGIGSFITKQTDVLVVPFICYQPRHRALLVRKLEAPLQLPVCHFLLPISTWFISTSAFIFSHHSPKSERASQLFLKWYNMCILKTQTWTPTNQINPKENEACSSKHPPATQLSKIVGTLRNTHTHTSISLCFLSVTAMNILSHAIWTQKIGNNENMWTSLVT